MTDGGDHFGDSANERTNYHICSLCLAKFGKFSRSFLSYDMRFSAQTLTDKLLLLAVHSMIARIDNGLTSSFHYVAATFSPLLCWAVKFISGRIFY